MNSQGHFIHTAVVSLIVQNFLILNVPSKICRRKLFNLFLFSEKIC